MSETQCTNRFQRAIEESIDQNEQLSVLKYLSQLNSSTE
jgi:hypothetical protein